MENYLVRHVLYIVFWEQGFFDFEQLEVKWRVNHKRYIYVAK